MENTSPAPLARLARKVPAIAVALLTGALVLGPMASAHAATYTYANDVRASSGQQISTGTRSAISGGSVNVVLGVSVTQFIKTYYPAPGYNEVARNAAGAGQTTHLSHATVSNATSACGWYTSGGGVASITCTVRS